MKTDFKQFLMQLHNHGRLPGWIVSVMFFVFRLAKH